MTATRECGHTSAKHWSDLAYIVVVSSTGFPSAIVPRSSPLNNPAMRWNSASSILGALCAGLLACAAHGSEGCASGLAANASRSVQGEASDDVRTVQTTLAGVPAVLRVPKTVKKAPIVLWHGLGRPGSEIELMGALPLDDVPAVKVYLGLPLLGGRAPSGDAQSLAQRQAEDYALLIFKPVVMGAAQELPAVLQALHRLKCLRTQDKIGLFGFSAGGTAVLLALRDSRIAVRAAITVNAPVGLNEAISAVEHATKTPYVWSDASRQLAEQSNPVLHAQEIAAGNPPRALLLFHGAADKVIPPDGTASLGEKLRPLYAQSGNDRRLSVAVVPGISHTWAEPGTVEQVRTSVADWFNRYL
jgi:dienelactone hydrolase